ncbi:uncharacterized protein JCM6883_000802 [Sporobolomyces salmoneus]|uniref:uncharacterized protein n=1 Tax=Sporobolomyces salmoneus TaxID=183962 RepID=UPI00317EE06B
MATPSPFLRPNISFSAFQQLFYKLPEGSTQEERDVLDEVFKKLETVSAHDWGEMTNVAAETHGHHYPELLRLALNDALRRPSLEVSPFSARVAESVY